MRNLKCLILMIACFIASAQTALAYPSAFVYANGSYTDDTVTVNIYVDVIDQALAGTGVKLIYNTTTLESPQVARNEDIWYIGSPANPLPYAAPDINTTSEVSFVTAKFDINNPTQGVGDYGILLGTVSFARKNIGEPVGDPFWPIYFGFGLDFAKSAPFTNFATTAGSAVDANVWFAEPSEILISPDLEFSSSVAAWTVTLSITNLTSDIDSAVIYWGDRSMTTCDDPAACGAVAHTYSNSGIFNIRVEAITIDGYSYNYTFLEDPDLQVYIP